MHGHERVLKFLGEALKAELTAINQYFLHGKMCDNWGYFRLGADYRRESIEEMVHAEKLIDRIIFLEGTPNMSDIGKINVGANVKASHDLQMTWRNYKFFARAVGFYDVVLNDRDAGEGSRRFELEAQLRTEGREQIGKIAVGARHADAHVRPIGNARLEAEIDEVELDVGAAFADV